MVTAWLMAAVCVAQGGPNLAPKRGVRGGGWGRAGLLAAANADRWGAGAGVGCGGGARGNRCLRIVNRADVKSRWRTGQLHDLRLRPATEATLSGWVRHEGVGSAYLTLYFLGLKGEVIAQPTTQRVTGEAGWTHVSVKAVAPSDAAYTMLYCENEGVGRRGSTTGAAGRAVDGEPKPAAETIPVGVDELDAAEGVQRRTAGTARVADALPGQAGHVEVWFGERRRGMT